MKFTLWVFAKIERASVASPSFHKKMLAERIGSEVGFRVWGLGTPLHPLHPMPQSFRILPSCRVQCIGSVWSKVLNLVFTP